MVQGDAFDQFLSNSRDRFDDWAYAQRTSLDDFIMDCKDAWNTILESYCLDDIDYLEAHPTNPLNGNLAQVANDLSDTGINFGLGRHYSHGCRAFGQVGGYKKDVDIEAHEDIIMFG
jgi:hypothetical protein